MAMALAMALAAAGCLGSFVPAPSSPGARDGGSAPPPAGNTGGSGGGGTADLSAAPADGGSVDGGGAGQPPPPDGSAPGCINLATPTIIGNHHQGEACMSACHDGANGPKFYAAGTVYDAASGGRGRAGVTVEVGDGTNTRQVVTASDVPGNFYIDQPLTGTLHARATACPANQIMATTGNVGDCNSCHDGRTTAVLHVP